MVVISVLADEDLLKSVLECLALQVLYWKVDHPSDTEEDVTVGLSSEDEVEGLEPTPRVARHGSSGCAPMPLESCPVADADEVLVKKEGFKMGKTAGFNPSSWGGSSRGQAGQGGC